MKKRKVLIVSQRYPLPEDHGNAMRTMNFVRFFRSAAGLDMKVDLLYCSGKDKNQDGGYFENEYIFHPISSVSKLSIFWKRLSKRLPAPMIIFDRVSLKRFVNLIKQNDYEFILFRYLPPTQLAFVLNTKYKKRIIFDIDDVPSANLYDMNFGSTGTFRRLMAKLNRNELVRYERRCLSMGASIFCSRDDRKIFDRNESAKNLFVVSNIYSDDTIDAYDHGNGFVFDPVLLFVGALGYRPNIEGLQWFLNEIYPKFRLVYPNARLMIVGRNPDKALQKWCNDRQEVELYANVPDIRPFYRKARVVIVPLLSGGGTRIKILEAAVSERPIISTPIGAAGLDFKNNKNIQFFQTSDDFIKSYEKLENNDYYARLIDNAKALVLKNYSLKSFNDKMKIVLRYINA